MTHTLDICICTFRRPELAETLSSLAQVSVPDNVSPNVIVVDNDDIDSARDLVENARLPFPVRYIHAPGRNISIARNAALEISKSDVMVFVDDDETVSPSWLLSLWSIYERDSLDVVFGPVEAIYPSDTPDWMISGDFHSTKLPESGERISTGCTANVLMRRMATALKDLRFDEELGRSGGEDTVFFQQVKSNGGSFGFAHNAIVFEKVNPKRLSLSWLLERKFRSGQSHAISVLGTSGRGWSAWAGLLGSATLKGGYCLARAGLHPFNAERRNFWVIRGALHAGVVTRCLGGRDQFIYGN